MTEAPTKPHLVVIVGAGFQRTGSVRPCRCAGRDHADRPPQPPFRPLLYQVATASLATCDIAWPIRHLLRDGPEVTPCVAS